MEHGPAFLRFSMSDHLAGVSVFTTEGRSCKVSTRSGETLRPSATRFHAASKRSSASRGGPTRSSRTLAAALAKTAANGGDVALEVVAQLLHGPEFVSRSFSADDLPLVLVQHLI